MNAIKIIGAKKVLKGTKYKCDICGKPATRAERDGYSQTNIETGSQEWKARMDKPELWGCDEHPPEATTTDLGFYFTPIGMISAWKD